MTTRPHRAASILVLGTDALLAARPASYAQLARGCRALGYDEVIPASVGDELLARATLERMGDAEPAILCSCPHVARRLLDVGAELEPSLVSLVSPPVALARWLRARAGDASVRVTYAGRCPGAASDEVDARLTPDALLASLADRGIALDAAVDALDAIDTLAPARHLSLPGGAPAPERLAEHQRELVELPRERLALEVAEHVMSGSDAVLDAAHAVGCCCAGACAGMSADEARTAVAAMERTRAPLPVLPPAPAVPLDLPLPAVARDAADLVARPPAPRPAMRPRGASRDEGESIVPLVLEPRGRGGEGARRASQPPRTVRGTIPLARASDGRALPRAYVGRRPAPRVAPPGLTTFDRRHVPIEREVTVPAPVAVDASGSMQAAQTDAPRIAPPVLAIVREPRPSFPSPGASLADAPLVETRLRASHAPSHPAAPGHGERPSRTSGEVAARIEVAREPSARRPHASESSVSPPVVLPLRVDHSALARRQRLLRAAIALAIAATAVGAWVLLH